MSAAQDASQIVLRSLEVDRANTETARNYTFLQREQERLLDGSGRVKSKQSRTLDVTLLEGSPYRRLVARNDQPLSPAEQKKEEEKLRKSIEDRSHETPEQRAQRIADWERRQQRRREPLKELPAAFDFKLAGQETLDGREAYVIDATPKPGYKPKVASASYLPKIKGRIWIDNHDYHWAKAEMETLDTISFAGFLLRLSKGSRLTLEQARINNEVWLPKRVLLQGSLRLILIKGLRGDLEITYLESTEIIGWGD